jgi:hypothetical protein
MFLQLNLNNAPILSMRFHCTRVDYVKTINQAKVAPLKVANTEMLIDVRYRRSETKDGVVVICMMHVAKVNKLKSIGRFFNSSSSCA